jgi:hypothetical protein
MLLNGIMEEDLIGQLARGLGDENTVFIWPTRLRYRARPLRRVGTRTSCCCSCWRRASS